ncbi:class I SAM-dependent methyltransferase [Rhodanobacter geophilus]|uniref:Class I SAM-dependent methyltransferase n=1 Tax=Rhodanobacter geophilus TaxID=3162488 RepID=A0ABV3QL78_9GAMM
MSHADELAAMNRAQAAPGLLGDTPQRDYTEKLRRFNAFARPELCEAIAALAVQADARVLDAGCGTGEALGWFRESAGDRALVVGIDLATAHVRATRRRAPALASVLQADMLRPPLLDGSFDLAWAVNTVNHLRDPVAGVRVLSRLLRPGGRLAIGQSSLVPDMYFAWDARLEQCVNEAVRLYYRERYGRSEHEFAAIRAVVGWLQAAGLPQVAVRTRMIERIQPLAEADERYLREAIFRDTWGERLRPYLRREDFDTLARLCDPDDARYALRRPDFHFLQSFTLAVATKP